VCSIWCGVGESEREKRRALWVLENQMFFYTTKVKEWIEKEDFDGDQLNKEKTNKIIINIKNALMVTKLNKRKDYR